MARSIRISLSTEAFEALNGLADKGASTPQTIASKIVEAVSRLWWEAYEIGPEGGIEAVTRWGTSHGVSEAVEPKADFEAVYDAQSPDDPAYYVSPTGKVYWPEEFLGMPLDKPLKP